jgi:ubiquinone/menaquinone biosynthesis C-methylase UbiE
MQWNQSSERRLEFPDASFDGIAAFYSIHIPERAP